MGGWRRYFFVLAGLSTVMGMALLFGAADRGAASTEGSCAGKLCITIDDQEKASWSNTSDHYVSYSVTVSNTSTTSTLVNVSLSATWSDTGATTTSVYKDGFSDPRCTLSGSTITCTTPKSLKPGDPPLTYNLVFRTATNTAATDTTLFVTALAKEQLVNKQGKTASTSDNNPTRYEGDANLDVSTAGGSIPKVTLATTQKGSPGYSEVANLPVPPNSSAVTATQGLYTLGQDDLTNTFCPSGYTCFGQEVTVVRAGLSPVNLQLTYTGPNVNGVTENNLVVVHYRTGSSTPTNISTACSGAVGSGQPPASEYSPNGCRRVHIDHLPGGTEVIQVDAWDTTNGGWGVGSPK